MNMLWVVLLPIYWDGSPTVVLDFYVKMTHFGLGGAFQGVFFGCAMYNKQTFAIGNSECLSIFPVLTRESRLSGSIGLSRNMLYTTP